MDHLGVEVDSTEAVHAATARLDESGLATTEESDTTCCYALQDKVWVHGPGKEPWEVYVVKADADSLTRQEDGDCCSPSAAPGTQVSETAKTGAPSGSCC